MAMDEYHAIDAASNSRLSRLLKSPAHLKAYLNEPPEETTALLMGRAGHCAILEPDDFPARYRCGPDGDKRTKAVKEAWDALEAEVGTGGVLRRSDYEACLRMRDSVHRSRTAKAMISGSGEVELSYLWEDKESGLLCKARMDRHSPDLPGGTIVDVKTTRSASRREFERTIFSFGYHRQGAFYLEGAKVRKLPARHFVILAVEKTPPYAVAVYRLTEGALSAGEEQIRPLLMRYAECKARNEWPGFPDEVVDVALPDYAWRQIDDELQEVA